MNIFSFTAEFGSEQECRLHFKQERDTQGDYARNIVLMSIIG